ncbi:MAG: single-stranded DNA-binding protein [Treponema bryantii]|nr:single-stranded DNA-binding protein [Treponema bryantii]
MNQLNSIFLEGNLVRDPEYNETQMGSSVCNFSLAVNRTFRDSKGEKVDEVSFFDVETWGNLAENLKKVNVKKGRGVRVVDRLKQERWKDAEGKSHSKIFVVAEHIELKQQIRKAPAKETDYERGM